MKIPFLDLSAQYSTIKQEIDQAIQAVISDRAFIRGPYVSAFERAFAAAHGFGQFVGVGNGTDALFIALKALNIGPGDEVITAANSWIASSESITLTGATPVFADVELATYNLDPEAVAERITDRTRAILPVHLYGHGADMRSLKRLSSIKGLLLVEDCAQAHLAQVAGELVGSWGEASAFSFYPGKNLGAYGDAGGVGTNDLELAQAIRVFANHGSHPDDKHRHLTEGTNSRLDGLQAAILKVKLGHLERWTIARIQRANWYDSLLKGTGDLVTPTVLPGYKHVFHVYCIRTQKRNQLATYLRARGIETAVHYPTALPFLDAYSRFGFRPHDFPTTHKCQREILSLPIYPEMTEEDVAYVASAIRDFY